jgi:2,3-bisphosphoglycerate-independent phosphoglycerate mutase
MKIILILLDGLGDRSYEELNFQTPLEAAQTPNLDRLASLGSNGLFHASRPGQCLPSETAHYLLFGYEMHHFPGRGLLEAVGEGVEFDDSDVLCLAHLAGITWQNHVPILTLGRNDITGSGKDIGRLFAAISPYETEGVRFRLHQTRRNDAILILSGPVSPFVSDSDPIVKGKAMGRIVPLSNNPEPEKAAITAKGLNKYLTYCHKKLVDFQKGSSSRERETLFANFLATQRCGRRIIQTPFYRRWGLKGMLIASVSVYAGLAHELGLEFVSVKDSGDPGRDLKDRIRRALDDPSHDFIHVHTKVPDEAAHTGDPENKKTAIAKLDQGLDELVNTLENRNDILVVVTADHSTPSVSPLIHSGETVPVAIVGPTIRRDTVQSFNEVSAVTGSLGLLRGRELMLMILNCSDRAMLRGHCLGETESAYFPFDYAPFKLT